MHRTGTGESGILEDSPEAWRDWAKNASPDEARAGAIADLQRRAASASKPVTEAEQGAPIPRIDQLERGRFDVLFGKDKTDQFIQGLRDARDHTALNRVLFQNSKTAERLRSNEEAKVRVPGSEKPSSGSVLGPAALGILAEPAMAAATGEPGLSMLLGMGAAATRLATSAGRYGLGKYREAQDISRNNTVARYATAGEGPERDLILNLLRNRLAASGPRNKFHDLLASPFATALPR